MNKPDRRPFLTAEWQYLTMLNYTVEPEVLLPFVPRGTELDTWNDLHTVSLVAFHFCDTRVYGIPIPFHRDFEEVNLRFYVTCQTGGERRRGVVFIKELVPRFFIAQTARLLYNEQYSSLPMSHQFEFQAKYPKTPKSLLYQWGHGASQCTLKVDVAGDSREAAPDSETAFITEHYWGYSRQRDNSTLQYHVDHPRWQVWQEVSASLKGDHSAIYGPSFNQLLQSPPRSLFVALGSPVSVYPGVPL